MYDIQRANAWKRISAYIIDTIFLVIIAVGVASLLSLAFSYDARSARLDELQASYEQEYGISFDITQEELDALSDEQRELYNKADEAFVSDPEVVELYVLLTNLTLMIISLSFLTAYTILEIIVPLLFKNGQTLGKKVFGIGVMREDCVRISTFQLIARTLLGKYTVETMLPIFLVLMLFSSNGSMALFCLVGLAALLLIQCIMTLATRLHTPIHDRLSGCVAIDIGSQMIFDSREDMLEYTRRQHAEMAEKAEYR